MSVIKVPREFVSQGYANHRYRMRQDITDWCDENLRERPYVAHADYVLESGIEIRAYGGFLAHFKDEHDAFAFKMRWL